MARNFVPAVQAFIVVLITGAAGSAQVRHQAPLEGRSDQDNGGRRSPALTDPGGRIASPSPKSRGLCGDGVCDAQTAESYGTCPGDCHTLDERADYFKGLLPSAFAAADEGVFYNLGADHCSEVPVCFFNNPTSEYGRLFFPLAPGEPNPDPRDRRGSPEGMEDLYHTYRLQPGEAIVWIGRTPPEIPYFSFTNYVYSRFDPEARGNPPYGDRVLVYASLGDSQNHLTLGTSAEPGESPFEKESVVIVTSDMNTDLAVRGVLNRAGFSDSITNTLVLPRFNADGVTPKIQMGYENEADIFSVVMRISSPDALDPDSPIRAWLDRPGSRVFRIRTADSTPLDPFALPASRPQGNGVSEDGVPLDWLVRRILNAHDEAPPHARIAWPLATINGDYCLDHMTQCNGDCRDTPYMVARFQLGPDPEAIIVAGRNHEASGKATYVNVTAARMAGKTAYYSVVMRELEGSAKVYLPNYPETENLWQLKFARKCRREPFCYELSEDQIPIDGLVAIIVRAYLDPSTATSPKVFPIEQSELVFPRAFKVNCVENCDPIPQPPDRP